jgi:hypothetical protein
MLRIDGRIDPLNAIDHTRPSNQGFIRAANNKIHPLVDLPGEPESGSH